MVTRARRTKTEQKSSDRDVAKCVHATTNVIAIIFTGKLKEGF